MGDRPIDIFEWVDAFSMALRGRHARKVPRSILAPMGRLGDLLAACGKTFPLTSSRFNNMVSDFYEQRAWSRGCSCGSPFSLTQGVEESVKWMEAGGLTLET